MEAPRELKPILDPQEVDPQFRPSSSILRLLSDTSLSRERSHRSQASRRKRLGDLASASHSCSRAGRRHGLRNRRPGQSILVFTALSLAIIRNSSIPPVLPLASAQPTIAPTSNTTSNSTLPTSSPVAPSNVTDAPVASSNVTVVPDSATPSTAAPVSAAPSTLAPVTAAPTTPPPTAPPVVITWPTVPPTPSPTISPTSSKEPSNAPSIPPTNYPTVSSRPTNPPSLSTAPSYPPSTSSPTVSPNKAPTLSPVVPPTASPSTNVTLSIVRECNQILEVSAPVEFVDVEVGIYQLQMQSYTANFGEMVGIPFVVTTCTVTEQNLAGGRRVVQREGSSRHGSKGDDSARDRRLGRKLEQFGALGEGVRKTTQNEEKRSHLQLAKWLRHNPGTDLQTDILEHMFPSSPSSRTLQTTTPRTLLVMQFNIQYESRYGVVIDNYPSLFQEYINSNLEQVTLDMQTKFLPVVSAREVIVYNTKQPTLAPTPGGSGRSILPTPVVPLPTPQGGSPFPTISPSGSPIDFNATAAPSASPTLSPFNVIPTPPPTPPKEIIEDNTSFVVGLAAGLSGAALLVILFICYKRRENRRKQEAIAIGLANNEEMRRRQAFDAPRIMEDDGVEITAEEAMIVGQAEEKGNGASESYGDGSHRHSSDGAINNSGNGSTDFAQSTQQQEPNGQHHQQGTIADSIYSNPSMVSGGGSFSSKEGDNYAEGDVLLDPLQDEFDNYKNQDLEFMRNGVEESVYGAEGMMSWAMTRALMEDDDEGIDLKWGGAQDPESIEANCLCETYDWLRKNDHSTLDERNQYFQDILSRMIVTVRKNMIKPNEGTRTIHCCASLLGLRLEKDLPNNVLIVTGMRKTNNLSEGRYYLMEAFKPFGTIEGAAIAPSNRGFGFVRFAHHKSVERALQSFRVSEIEVQDVSVMIKALKSESPGV